MTRSSQVHMAYAVVIQELIGLLHITPAVLKVLGIWLTFCIWFGAWVAGEPGLMTTQELVQENQQLDQQWRAIQLCNELDRSQLPEPPWTQVTQGGAFSIGWLEDYGWSHHGDGHLTVKEDIHRDPIQLQCGKAGHCVDWAPRISLHRVHS